VDHSPPPGTRTVVREEPGEASGARPGTRTVVRGEPGEASGARPGTRTVVREEPGEASGARPGTRTVVREEPGEAMGLFNYSKLQQAQFPGFQGCLRSVTHAQFFQDVRDVVFHRAFGDEELVGDLLIGGPCGDQCQDL